jgi:hypothetical protein
MPRNDSRNEGVLRLRILGSHTDDWSGIARDDKAEQA